MTYQLYKTFPEGKDGVLKNNGNGSTSSFLLGVKNPEEQAYLKWLEEGNTPLPAENT